jgi:monoamine oxidase
MTEHSFFGPTRRSLLSGLAAGASALAVRPGFAAAPSYDVVIVGAGAAGIGAAIQLQKAKLSYLIVEAEKRIGGRAYTDTKTFRGKDNEAIPFDIGCAWIHRYRNGDPFADWSRSLSYETQAHNLEVSELYYGSTPYSSLMVEMQHRDEESLKNAFEKSAKKKRDVAASTLVTDWRRPMDAAATYMGPMDMAVDFTDMSTSDFAAMADYEPNYLVRKGYGTLVSDVALSSNLNIALGTRATAIDYTGRSGVTVQTSGAQTGTIEARAVIVTVSTGVLAKDTINFTPPLTAEMKLAVDDLPMGLLAKIPLQIPGVSHFLGGVKPYDNILEQYSNGDDIYFLAWPWNLDLIVGFVGGKFAKALSDEGEPAAVAFAKERLGDIFGTDLPGKVQNSLLTPWWHNENVLGAYSAAKPGKHASRAKLAVPIQDRVYLAGEATGPQGMFATASGAYLAGSDAAGKIARRFKAAKA